MIEEPPLLQIRRPTQRPTEAQLSALRGTPTGFLADAMGGKGAFDCAMAPLSVTDLPVEFCGVALTCETGPDDILAMTAGLTQVQSGDVLVVATGAWRGSASAGDRVIGMARNGGAVAFVTDGLVRDYEGIVEVGLPVVCAGLTPNSPFSKGPGKVGFPVILGGRQVETGDVIIGDRSGTVVVPFDDLDRVIAEVAHISEIEAALDAKVAEGLTAPAKVQELVQSDQVAWS